MSQNRIDKAIATCDAAVLRRLRQYDAELEAACAGCGQVPQRCVCKAVLADAEADFARAEAQQLSATDRAFLNSLIDEQREQDAIADADYADRMLERMEEDRNDH